MAVWPYNTPTWRRLRAAKLLDQPLCQPCEQEGRMTAANTVDHVKRITDGGDPFPGLDGLASMCASCHSRKTAHVDMQGKARVPVKGCDPATGLPLDKGHWWRGGDR